MKTIAVSYRALFEIIEALQFKLDAERKRNREQMTEDEAIDFDHDVAFLEEVLKGTKLSLENWRNLPDA